jgi:hypothetical protein
MGIPDDFGDALFASFGPQAGLYLLESCPRQRIDCYLMMKGGVGVFIWYVKL